MAGPIGRVVRNKWFLLALIIFLPFLLLIFLLWYIIGVLLTMSTFVVASFSTILTWILYLNIPGIPFYLLDWPIIYTIAYIAMTFINIDNKRAHISFQFTLCIALAIYSIVRSRLTLTPYTLVTIMTILGCILPFWVALCRLRLWLPADEKILEETERMIYNKYMINGYNAHKVAGLGTVHVPYCGEDTRLTPRTLVLVHGYFAGNAFWAAV